MQHLLWVDVSNLSDNSIAVIIFIVAIVIVGCYLQIVIGRESVRRKIKKLRTLLHEYGIDAQLAEKHCPEERIGSRGRFIPGALAWVSGGDSAGVLNISTGPIGWVNLLEYQFGDSPTDNWYVYGIPDKRIHPGCPKVHLNSSWYSKTIGVKWEGNDHTTGLKEWLSQQTLEIKAELEIELEPNHYCWIISTRSMPTLELWNCYQLIARKLQSVILPAI